MRCEIIWPEEDLERTIWTFYYIDSFGGVVLDSCLEQERPSKRHKFRTKRYWQRIDQRSNTMDRPKIPPVVSVPALEKLRDQVQWKADELW